MSYLHIYAQELPIRIGGRDFSIFWNMGPKDTIGKTYHTLYLDLQIEKKNYWAHIYIQQKAHRDTVYYKLGNPNIDDIKANDTICTLLHDGRYLLMLHKNATDKWEAVNAFCVDASYDYGGMPRTEEQRMVHRMGPSVAYLLDPQTVFIEGRGTGYPNRIIRVFINGDIEIYEYDFRKNFVKNINTKIAFRFFPSALSVQPENIEAEYNGTGYIEGINFEKNKK